MRISKKWLINEEGGQGMVEYSLIITLVALLLIGSLITLGEKTSNLYEKTEAALPS